MRSLSFREEPLRAAPPEPGTAGVDQHPMTPCTRPLQPADTAPGNECLHHCVLNEVLAVAEVACHRPCHRHQPGVLGAIEVLLKEAPAEHILSAIRDVADGRAVIDPKVTQAVIDQLGVRPARRELFARVSELTPREREVLVLVARGLSNGEISAELFIGGGTTKTHVAHILAKLGVRDRAQAIVLAFEAGIA